MNTTHLKSDEAVRKLRIAFGVETTDDLIKEMVNRFLGWQLPAGFSPDCYISFDRALAERPNCWPIGTNLLTADQAEAMIQHMLGVA